MSEPAAVGESGRAVEALELTIKGASAYGREDLVTRLVSARRLLAGAEVLVYVVGEFKQGKSSLINALLTARVCAVDDDIATEVPTEVHYAQAPVAAAVYVDGAGDQRRLRAEPIRFEDAPGYASEAGGVGVGARARGLERVRIGLNRQLLIDGLVLVDTPGVGGLGSVHTTVTVGALPSAHAVIFVSDASQELTNAEVKFLRTAQRLCPTIIFALTKIDLHAQWRRILELNLEHLRDHGIAVVPVAVSSELRLRAAREVDQELNVESGFPRLVSSVHQVITGAEQLSVRSVGHQVLSVVEQLESTVRARRAALLSPAGAEASRTELRRARERLQRLRERSARWQQMLFDGFADISSDIDHDLRTRSRAVLSDAEVAIEQGDPAKNAEQFGVWLRQRLAAETTENYARLVDASRELAGRIGEYFEFEESNTVLAPRVDAPVAAVESIPVDVSFAAPSRLSSMGMAGLQRAYSGMMMFTVLTRLAALALPLPVGIAAAALMGRGGIVEDRRRQLELRRGKAKVAVRRFVDEFNTQVGKDSRDALRRLQRELRDGYTEHLDELLRSLTEALGEAEQAAHTEQDQQQQLARLERDLASLAMLRTTAGDLLAISEHEGAEHEGAEREVAGHEVVSGAGGVSGQGGDWVR